MTRRPIFGLRPHVIGQIALTTVREFVRTKEALFWTYGFPILMALALGLAFGESPPAPARVLVVEGEGAAALATQLAADPWLQVETAPAAAAREAFDRGQADLLVHPGGDAPRLERDGGRAPSRLAYLAVERALVDAPSSVELTEAHARGEPYIDFLLPGLLGMNLLGAGLFGVGFVLVDLRSKNLLRRLIVAPMGRTEFLLGFLLSRMGLVLIDAIVLVAFGWLLFGVPVRGSWTALLALVLLGGAAFTALGLVIASRARTIEAVSGLMNLVMLPMWLMGGIFFESKRFPAFLQPMVDAMPLTHLNDALRGVMLQGQGLGDVAGALLFLAAFAALGLCLAVRIFRWT